jgi:Zn-dependent protease with chaperone function
VIVAGTFFPAGSSRAIPARASLEGKTLRISDETGAVLVEFPLRQVRASSRLGNVRRRIELPDGSRFETEDNDGIDALFQSGGRYPRGAVLHWLESSYKWVVASVALAALSITLTIMYGLPAAALWLAERTPHRIAVTISEQSLQTLDRLALHRSQLDPADMHKVRILFARISAAGKQGKSGYRLMFRDGGAVGPNAFSLPDGTVIMTDQLYRLVRRDDELEGVFGHEIAHVDRRHALQLAYEGSLLPVAIALITGDASQFGQVATVLPLMLLQSHYSRGFEQQADDDSAVMMRRIGGDPAAMAALLERLDKEICGGKECAPGWLASHPATTERISRLRQEGKSQLPRSR